MSMSESVTEFSEVLPPYYPPPTSSSVRVVGLVVVVGRWGGTDSGTKAYHPSFLSSPFLVYCEWMLHEKTQASILLEVDLSDCPESYCYYYYIWVISNAVTQFILMSVFPMQLLILFLCLSFPCSYSFYS